MNKHTLALATGFVILWNSGFVSAEYGLPYVGPFTLLFWRYLALTLIIGGYLRIRNRFRWVRWPIAAPHMLIGVLAHGLWLTGVLLALNNGVPAGIVALLVALQPMATGALAGLVTGERTCYYQWLGLFFGFLGVLFTVLSRIDFSSYTSVVGYLLPLGSALSMTAASLIQRRMEIYTHTSKLPVDLELFYQSLATTLVVTLPAIFVEQLAVQWEPVFIYTMAWLVLAVSLGSYALMWLLIEQLNATRVASLFYLGPPVTMLMAWAVFGDTVQLMDIIGLVIVFIGVVITQGRCH